MAPFQTPQRSVNISFFSSSGIGKARDNIENDIDIENAFPVELKTIA